MYMIEKDVISQLVEEKLASSGNYLVDVVIKPGNLIIIEIDNDEGVCIDDCAELSLRTAMCPGWTPSPPGP